jgi:DNA-3-methyladenine glycosylase
VSSRLLTQAHSEPVISQLWLSRPSTVVAPELLGCTLVRRWPDGHLLRSVIVETEAYAPGDPACHGYRRRTLRNAAMFGPAGRAYVYLIYGLYHCLNVVTDQDGVPSAVLIRALLLEALPPGIDLQKERKPECIAAGPGKLCRALQIDRQFDGLELASGQALWLEHRSATVQHQIEQGAIALVQTTRIGISQGADLPWRWYVADCPAVSKP